MCFVAFSSRSIAQNGDRSQRVPRPYAPRRNEGKKVGAGVDRNGIPTYIASIIEKVRQGDVIVYFSIRGYLWRWEEMAFGGPDFL